MRLEQRACVIEDRVREGLEYAGPSVTGSLGRVGRFGLITRWQNGGLREGKRGRGRLLRSLEQ